MSFGRNSVTIAECLLRMKKTSRMVATGSIIVSSNLFHPNGKLMFGVDLVVEKDVQGLHLGLV